MFCSLLVLVQEIPGVSLREIAKTADGLATVTKVIKTLWMALPKMHKYWGFSGGFDKDGIYYDEVSGKITVQNWDRGQLPIFHLAEIEEGLQM